MIWRGIIHHYREFLPVADPAAAVTLGEGNTPLLESPALSHLTGLRVYLKCEGANPTGSFKDRGMTMAVTRALEEGARTVICASTGNTAASAAAYAARAGLRCFVVLPHGAVALGKLAGAIAYGARIIPIQGAFDEALALVRQIAEWQGVYLVNSLNPYRLEGQKTAAFEVCDQLGRAPDILCIPVGNAGNITAYWMGFGEYRRANRVSTLPRLMGFQAEGAAPIVRGHPIANPQTVATAIRIGHPARWREAEAAARNSGGLIAAVSDDEILAAYHMLAEQEGVFVEPASAASVAGLLKLARLGQLERGALAVCVLTGHGLKDPETALKRVPDLVPVPARLEAVLPILQG
jgi:threonine synthase